MIMLHETMEISLKRAKLEKMIHLANPKKFGVEASLMLLL